MRHGGQLSLPRREGLFLDEAPPSQGGGSFIIRKPRARVARRIPDHDVVNGADVQPQLTEKVRGPTNEMNRYQSGTARVTTAQFPQRPTMWPSAASFRMDSTGIGPPETSSVWSMSKA